MPGRVADPPRPRGTVVAVSTRRRPTERRARQGESMLRYLVLGLLRDGAPRHGYAIRQEYRRRAGLEPSTGPFYRELGRLLEEELIRETPNPPGSDPRRTPYVITKKG